MMLLPFSRYHYLFVYKLFLFISFFCGLSVVRAFVPFTEHRGDATFPIFAPVTMLVMTTPHAAEEHHLHEARDHLRV